MRTVMIAMLASTVLSLPAVAQQPNQLQTNQSQTAQAPTQQSRSQVRQAQGALDQKGFKAGRPDGIMGRQTEAALRNFQKQQHTQATGKLDNQTLAALGVNTQRQNQGTNRAQPRAEPNTGSAQQQSQSGGQSGMSQSSGRTGQNANTNGK